MYRYVIKRILMMIPVMLGVTFVIFSMMYISEGDPARMILGEGAQEAEVEALREELGLNDPFLTRYVNYIKGIVTEGDLGVSYTTGRSVSEEIFDRWPTTMLLAVLSFCWQQRLGFLRESYQQQNNIQSLIIWPWFWLLWACPCQTSGRVWC